MKKLITLLFIIFSFGALAQFQPLKEADWTLWDRDDHKMHLFVGQVIIFVPQLVMTYIDEDNPDFIKPLKYTITTATFLILGKEFIWDSALGLGSATFPDLAYGLLGELIGLGLSYGLYKIERWHINKHEKLKL